MNAPIQIIYVLIAIVTALTILFGFGKGALAIALKKDFLKKEPEKYKKRSRILGVCLGIVDLLLIFTAVMWGRLPEWYMWIFDGVIAIVILAAVLVSNIDIIQRKEKE